MAPYTEAEWQALCKREQETAYGSAYVEHAPRYREIWCERTIQQCHFALIDLHDTLRNWPHQTAYTAKLWAEVDAIRDRQMAIRGL